MTPADRTTRAPRARTIGVPFAAAAVVLGALVAVGAVMGPFAPPAAAKKRETLTLSIDKPLEVDFDGIPGQYAGNQGGINFTPSGCEDPAVGLVCDNIPLKIVVPDVPDTDDWLVRISVSWHDPDELNDVDVYWWDNLQTDPETNPDDDSYTLITSAASAANPETMQEFEPTLGEYNITVVNFSGVNLGYHLSASMSNAEFTSPHELLAPGFRSRQTFNDDDPAPKDLSDVRDEDTAAPFDFSADVAQGAPAHIPPSFGEVAAVSDPDFNQFPPTDFDSEISAPPPRRAALADLPPIEKASVAVVAFWLGLVPLLLMAGGALVLLRRSRTSFALAGL